MYNLKSHIIRLIFLSFVLSSLIGCHYSKISVSEENTTEQSPYHIAIITKGFQHEFWQVVKAGAYQAANEFEVKLTFDGPVGDYAINQQIEMIRDIINDIPDLLIIAAVDSNALIPVLEDVQAQGIPIIAIDSGIDSDLPLTTISTNNREAAKLAADKMAKAINYSGEIGIICHDKISKTGFDRYFGFVNQIETQYPDIKIVESAFGLGEHDYSKKQTDKMIDNHPKLKGIFAANEGSAIGMITSIIEKDKKDLILIGFDAGKLQKEAIKEGILYGSISQEPLQLGYLAVKSAYEYLNGTTIDTPTTYTGFFWYDKDNINDTSLKSNLYN